MQEYLCRTDFIDSDHPEVVRFAVSKTLPGATAREKAVALYLAVRDGWRYDPFTIDLHPESLTASHLLTREHGYCVEKAVLLAALGRAVNIPTRLGFAHVTNHLGTSKLEELLRTDRLVFHGYTELYIENKWVKATPAFNRELCEHLKVPPLEFDGIEDSIFQAESADGTRFMEYLHDYGVFNDLPYDFYISELERHYPHIFTQKEYHQDGFNFSRP